MRDYRDKKYANFILTNVRYMRTMLHMAEAKQSQYILAQTDIMCLAFATLGSLEFVEPPRSTAIQIPYGQLFQELKLRLI